MLYFVYNQTAYYLYNGHADVVALVDGSGNTLATYYYDAFGNIVEQTGTIDNNIIYAGYQYDKETGKYYLNARMYDPITARFMQEDTYRGDKNDPLSLNLYTYCHNEPLMYVDPTGHWGKGVHCTSTSEWAKSLGFSKKESNIIGNADNDVDSKYAGALTDSSLSDHTYDDWHFNMNSKNGGENTLLKHSNDYYNKAVQEWKKADSDYADAMNNLSGNFLVKKYKISKITNQRDKQRETALNDLGTALHPLQDIYAHGNITTMSEHSSYSYPEWYKNFATEGMFVIDNPNYDINSKTGKVTKGSNRINFTETSTKEVLKNFRKDIGLQN